MFLTLVCNVQLRAPTHQIGEFLHSSCTQWKATLDRAQSFSGTHFLQQFSHLPGQLEITNGNYLHLYGTLSNPRTAKHFTLHSVNHQFIHTYIDGGKQSATPTTKSRQVWWNVLLNDWNAQGSNPNTTSIFKMLWYRKYVVHKGSIIIQSSGATQCPHINICIKYTCRSYEDQVEKKFHASVWFAT